MEPRSTAFTSAGTSIITTRSVNRPHPLPLDHVSPATRLLDKRRQMFEMQEALDAEKREFARWQDAFHCRKVALHTKELALQKSLIRMNKCMQENESKRTRAVKRASDEVKQRTSKEQEVADLQAQLTARQRERETLKLQVRHHLKYARYLEQVQEAVPEDYPQVSDLVHRYHTLRETNCDLRQQQSTREEDSESKRLAVAEFQKEGATETLAFTTRIAALQHTLERAAGHHVDRQHETEATLRAAAQNTLALGQLILAIAHLLQQCSSGPRGRLFKHIDESCRSTDVEFSTTTAAAMATLSTGRYSLETEVIRHGQRSMVDLNVVAAYMTDFTAIVQGHMDAHRAQRKVAAARRVGGPEGSFAAGNGRESPTGPARGTAPRATMQ